MQKPELLLRPKYPATQAWLERNLVIVCYAALAYAWVNRHFLVKRRIPPSQQHQRRRP